MRKKPLNPDAPATAARPFDASKTFTSGAQKALENAQELARSSGNPSVESVHLLLGALQLKPPNPQLSALFQLSGLKPEEVRLYAQAALENQQSLAPEALPALSARARNTIQMAGTEARRNNCAQVDVSHFVIACFRPQTESGLTEVLAPLGVSADQLSKHLRGLKRGKTAAVIYDESPLAHLTGHSERALEAAYSAMRAQFCGRISTLHLLVGILENPESDAVVALQTLMIDVGELKRRADVAATGDGQIASPNRRFTPAAKRALDRAKAAARDGGRSHIGSADLLIGLLPQPMLLIERAQFGARPDDPAAALLRDVDADLVRAIFNPRTPATAPAKPRSTLNLQAILQSPALLVFALQVAIGFALQGFNSHPANSRPAIFVLISVLVGVLILTAMLTIWALIFSKNSRHKSTCIVTFISALAGAMAAMAIAGKP